jgi:spore coat polysaccharide biosynthesis protein SpsF
MMDVAGKPLLYHFIYRLKHSKLIDKIVIATTIDEKDDVIAEFSENMGVLVFRGSEEDVLDRYYHAAKENKADIIVRVTADCPLIDPQVVDQAISIFVDNKLDYLSNSREPTFPHGQDVEVFSMEALEKAFKEAKLPSEREHVTPYIWKNTDTFKAEQFRNEENLSHFRWTVDHEKDLELVREIFKELRGDRLFHMNEIVQLMKRRPELQKINTGIDRYEGYKKSIKTEESD